MAVQETKKECVHVKTQEEWDYVMSNIGVKYYNKFNEYKENTIITLADFEKGDYGRLKTHKEAGYKILTFEEFKQRYEPTEAFNPQPHYDNTKGSLYKVAEDRKWNSYQFDIIKRIDRAMKKGKFKEDLQKTKDLIDLWLLESKQNGL